MTTIIQADQDFQKNKTFFRFASRRWMLVVLLLLQFIVFLNADAQLTDIHYNDTRTTVILPQLTQTQPGIGSKARADTGYFYHENYAYISSSIEKSKITHNHTTYLQFSLKALPQGAIVDSVTLFIYPRKVENRSSEFEQFVNLYELNGPAGAGPVNITDSSSSAISPVSKSDLSRAVKLQLEVTDGVNWARNRNNALYCVLAAEEAETYQYYTDRAGDLGKQPKLVIQYHMPENQVRKNSWPQYKYDAQHTGMLPWRSNAAATGFKLNEVFSPNGANYIMSDPVLNKGKLVFAYQSAAPPMYRVRIISEKGALLAETAPDDTIGLVKYGPIADRNSAVYCITGQSGNLMKVLDPDNLRVISQKKLENNAQAIALPVIGFDGSIYVSTNKGIYAYTPQPECKLKWIYTSGTNLLGAVSLDDEEGAVYFYDERLSSIVALNSIDGVEKWIAAIEKKINNDIPGDITVPVLKSNLLYTTNGFRSGDRFYIINKTDGTIIKGIPGNGNIISQPVAGTKNVFIINNGQLETYGLALTPSTNTSSVPLNPTSAMAADADNNVYILNTEQGKQSFMLRTPGKNSDIRLDINNSAGNLTGNRLLLSPAGTAFIGNDNHILGISPTGFSVEENITIPFSNASNFDSEFLYRSKGTIDVTGKTINSTQNVIIHSGSAITFQPGFSVKSGGTLACNVGY